MACCMAPITGLRVYNNDGELVRIIPPESGTYFVQFGCPRHQDVEMTTFTTTPPRKLAVFTPGTLLAGFVEEQEQAAAKANWMAINRDNFSLRDAVELVRRARRYGLDYLPYHCDDLDYYRAGQWYDSEIRRLYAELPLAPMLPDLLTALRRNGWATAIVSGHDRAVLYGKAQRLVDLGWTYVGGKVGTWDLAAQLAEYAEDQDRVVLFGSNKQSLLITRKQGHEFRFATPKHLWSVVTTYLKLR